MRQDRANLVNIEWILPNPGTFVLLILLVVLAQNAGALLFRALTLAGDSTTIIVNEG